MLQWLSNFDLGAGYIISLLFIVTIFSIFFFRRLIVQQRILKNKLFQLQNEIKAINSGNLGMGKKINQCAEEISKVDIENMVMDKSATNEKVYQQAGLLLSRGATIEEVVESCDIAPAEAELLAILKHSGVRKPAIS